MLNADVIERAITDTLFEALGNNKAMSDAVFAALPDNTEIEELHNRQKRNKKKLTSLEQKLKNVRKAIIEFREEDMDSFLKLIKDEVTELEKNKQEVIRDIQSIDAKLVKIPSAKQIQDKRNCTLQLIERIAESYFSAGYAFRDLPFQDKQKIVRLIFGGKDAMGGRFGIYVRPTGERPKKYEFLAYGMLGVIEGRIEDHDIESVADHEMYSDRPQETIRQIADIVKEYGYKECVLGKCHAHHGLGVHQRRRAGASQGLRGMAG